MEISIQNSFNKLLNYIESENFKGYDPYDTLNSWVPFHLLGKWGPILATQFQKRNPINIRPLLGIKKDYNPKAMGLFLQAYSLLYAKNNKKEYLEKADYFFNWLKKNYSEGFSGHCWGYNFPWATPVKYAKPFTPSSVVTGFVCRGIYEYFKISNNEKAKNILISSSDFILKDIPLTEDENGVCFSYTPIMKDQCFNSSLLAAEVLAITDRITNYNKNNVLVNKAVDWVTAHQKNDGRWNYSIDSEKKKERVQIDFHQGYILESIFEIKKNLNIEDKKWEESIKKGLKFYREQQFFDDGSSYWRWPNKYPVEIHNQAQGIITFLKFNKYSPNLEKFASTIVKWTIKNMQSKDGHFYYQNHKYYKHKISYMRWSNAWMFLAFTYLLNNQK
jgi:hypothetical protein